jgi:hypothetical protein
MSKQWKISKQGNVVVDQDNAFICDLNSVRLDHARLIAAAPELLTMLECSLRLMEMSPEPRPPKHWRDAVAALIAQVKGQ